VADHYYSKTPEVMHDRQLIEETMRGEVYKFYTDAGVFSKKGIDYGSRVLIESMQIAERAQVLDVGCGYGPIGLSAARLAAKGHVTMVDINERAVALAQENAALNRITNVSILQSDTFEKLTGQTFDVILTNPPIRAGKETVHYIFEQAYEHLNLSGALWIVIQKKQGAPSAFSKLESLFGSVKEVCKDKGYRIFRAVKS
jgi:16S rRNA (guanine1207-N2)-methyltransferase